MLKQLVFIVLSLFSLSVYGLSKHAFPAYKEFDSYYLLKVNPELNDMDYKALMSARFYIYKQLGNEQWPSSDFTEQQNLITLENDLKQFNSGENFTFHIFERETEQVIGCIYLTPVYEGKQLMSFNSFYWLVPKLQQKAVFKQLEQDVKGWLAKTHAKTVSFEMN